MALLIDCLDLGRITAHTCKDVQKELLMCDACVKMLEDPLLVILQPSHCTCALQMKGEVNGTVCAVLTEEFSKQKERHHDFNSGTATVNKLKLPKPWGSVSYMQHQYLIVLITVL